MLVVVGVLPVESLSFAPNVCFDYRSIQSNYPMGDDLGWRVVVDCTSSDGAPQQHGLVRVP